ncbi:MAG: hypothetical protein V5B44_04650 [Candidatus Accumulibacter necessarius]|jgi:hypothetical protein|uniref:hypothetical protein n=1 Tax=Candidatus Accumulibacter necessarius TaxID=2954386 RepID=UPI002FC39FD6
MNSVFPVPGGPCKSGQRSVVQQFGESLPLLLVEANLVSVLVFAVVSGEVLVSDRNVVGRRILVAGGVEQIEEFWQDPFPIKQPFKSCLPFAV